MDRGERPIKLGDSWFSSEMLFREQRYMYHALEVEH